MAPSLRSSKLKISGNIFGALSSLDGACLTWADSLSVIYIIYTGELYISELDGPSPSRHL